MFRNASQVINLSLLPMNLRKWGCVHNSSFYIFSLHLHQVVAVLVALLVALLVAVVVSMVLVRTMVVMVMLVKIVVVVLAILVGRKKRDRMAGLEFGPCVPRVGWWTMVR